MSFEQELFKCSICGKEMTQEFGTWPRWDENGEYIETTDEEWFTEFTCYDCL